MAKVFRIIVREIYSWLSVLMPMVLIPSAVITLSILLLAGQCNPAADRYKIGKGGKKFEFSSKYIWKCEKLSEHMERCETQKVFCIKQIWGHGIEMECFKK